MINEKLLEYIRIQRTAGLSKEAITQALAAGGWTAGDVNEAFMAIDGVSVQPAPPPIPQTPPVQITPRTIIPPVGAQTVASSPVGSISQSTPSTIKPRPVLASSEFGTDHVKGGRSWIWMLMLLIFIVIIVGGVAAATFFNPSIIESVIVSPQHFFTPPPAQQTPIETPVTPSSTTSTTTGTTASTSLSGSTSTPRH